MAAFLIGITDEMPSTMMESFRVLAAALRLKEFTTGRLSDESRLDNRLVEELVRSRSDLFPPVASRTSDGRRETVHSIAELPARAEMQAAADAIPLPEADAVPEILLNLARSSLLQLVPIADRDERRQLLAAARGQLAAAEGAANSLDWNELASRREHLETLVEVQDWMGRGPGRAGRPWFKPLDDAIEVVLRQGPAASPDLLRVVIAMPGLMHLVGRDFDDAGAPASIHGLRTAFDALIAIHMLPYSSAAAATPAHSPAEPLRPPARAGADATGVRPNLADQSIERLIAQSVSAHHPEDTSGAFISHGLVRVRMSGPLIGIQPKDWDPFQLHGGRHVPEAVIEAFDVDLSSRTVVGAVVTSERTPSTLIQYGDLEWFDGKLTYRHNLRSGTTVTETHSTGPVTLQKSGSCTWTTSEHLQIRLDGGQSFAVLDTSGALPGSGYHLSKIGDVWLLDFEAANGQLVSAHLLMNAYSTETVPFARLEYEPGREAFTMLAMPGSWVGPDAPTVPERTQTAPDLGPAAPAGGEPFRSASTSLSGPERPLDRAT